MTKMKPQVVFQDLGLISYKKAWDYQQALLEEVKDRKLGNRHKELADQITQKSYLLLCHHKPVYTLGKSGSK